VSGLAQALGVSTKTVLRWEKRGWLERPAFLPGHGDVRWYPERVVEEAQALLADGGHGALRSALGRFSQTRPVGPRDVEDDVEGWRSPAERRDGVQGGDAPPEPGKVDRCPYCKRELIWEQHPRRGARAEYGQVAVCGRCGPVETDVPEPVDGDCVRCGGEVTWQEPEGEERPVGGFVAVCDRCGPTTVHTAAHSHKAAPGRHRVAFIEPPVVAARRRGLQLGDIPGSVRKTTPPPPSGPTFLPPYETPRQF
jgi:hypothetical protein